MDAEKRWHPVHKNWRVVSCRWSSSQDTVHKGPQVTVHKGPQVTVHKGPQVTVHKGPQVTSSSVSQTPGCVKK